MPRLKKLTLSYFKRQLLIKLYYNLGWYSNLPEGQGSFEQTILQKLVDVWKEEFQSFEDFGQSRSQMSVINRISFEPIIDMEN